MVADYPERCLPSKPARSAPTLRRLELANRREFPNAGTLNDEIFPIMVEFARDLKARRARVFADGPWEFLFSTGTGTPLWHENFRRRVYEPLFQKAGIRRRTIHDLRHTYATLHLMAGRSMDWVKQQLGHSSITVTIDLYRHWLPSSGMENAYDPLDSQKPRTKREHEDEE